MSENLDTMPNAGSAAERYERLKRARDLVRRTSLLPSTDLPLDDLFGQLAALLAVFVDASGAMVAIGDEREARVEFNFGSATITGLVLRSGEPVLLRRVEDWHETPRPRRTTFCTEPVQPFHVPSGS